MMQRSLSAACLRERVSALADGSLPDDVRDRSLAHVTGCVTCRAALDAERALVGRLRGLPTPTPSAAMTARLLALGETGGPLPPRPGRVAGTPRQPTATLAAVTPPARAAGSTRPPGRREPRRSRRVLVAAAGVLGVGVVVVTAWGSSLPVPGPAVSPPVDQLSIDYGAPGVGGLFNEAALLQVNVPGAVQQPTAVPAVR